MKKLLKTLFVLCLAAVFTVGLGLVNAPDASAGQSCPLCYVPAGASGWTQVGSCIGGPAHCPEYYRLYENDYTGQLCRGQFPIGNI